MISPAKRLLQGALLGDVVESMTGHDIIVKRSPNRFSKVDNEQKTKCSYSTQAFSGLTIVGVAKVSWEGNLDYYHCILNSRMRHYLKKTRSRPVITYYDPTKAILKRSFTHRTRFGTLHICERLYLKRIRCLTPSVKRARISDAGRVAIKLN
ncbi:MAG: hypothetical protein WCS89_03800 [Candidatus Paceibacterota bacterium]|jgi:hypothetical protein